MPVSSNCTTRALFAGGHLVDAEHLAGVLVLDPERDAGLDPRLAAGRSVGNDVMRSRAAPIGISVTVSTGSVLRRRAVLQAA